MAAAALLAASAGVYAQEGAPAERRWYIGAGGGQAQWRPGCTASVPDCDDTNVSVHGFAGYKITSIFSGEIALTNYGKAIGTNMEVKGHGWEASALAAWPLSSSISVHGRLGIFRAVVKGGGELAGHTETSHGVTYGFGAQADFTPAFGARLEWQAFPGVGGSTIPHSDIKIISVSALWRWR